MREARATIRTWRAAAVAAALCLGCSAGEAETAGTPAPSELSTLVERFWDFYLHWHPLEATYLGEAGYDDLVPDVTPGARAARRSQASTLAGGLAAVDVRTLTPGDRLTHMALEQELATELARQTCEPETWVVDHREGVQLAFLNIVTAQPLETPEDGDRMIRRWNAIPDYIDDYISNLKAGLETGRVAARPSINRTIMQLDALIERPVETWPLYAPAGTDIGHWPEGTRHDFRAAIREAVTNRIRPAYIRLRDFLRDELYVSSRTDGEVGLRSLPGGDECYRTLIREQTTLDLDPEAIHALGLEELARIRSDIAALGERTLGISEPGAIARRLRDDPEMHFRWPAEIVQTASAAYRRAEAAMPGWFGVRPRAELVIKPIPDYEAPHSIVAYYRQPAPDGSRPGTYHVNTYRPEIRPTYQAEVLTFHEGIPGHHLQTAIAQEATGLPEFRRHLGSTAFIEGWALYAEGLADEMGLYSGDLDRLGLLSYQAWRASRLVVDTGIHAFGWTRERAVAFLRENTLLAEPNIENEVDRYITSPAQALTYKLGELEIRRLRAEAEERLGERFRVADFHDRVLENGALTLPALRESIATWLAAAGARAAG